MSTSRAGAEGGEPRYPRPFGPYLLLRPLNRGGMGEVFLAKHGKVDGIEKFCVVKTLRRAFTDDDDYVGRFIEEARVVVHLGHRNICHVFDVGKVSERYYLAMELIAGRDLRRVQDAAFATGRRLPVELALHVGSQVLEALDYAHRHVHPATGDPLGLVHRDVSPQNVMVNLEGEVKLIDFGLAVTNLSTELGSDSGVVIGKLAYMAPEQLEGTVVDARCDVFSAAVVLYELLTGHRFYEGLSRNEIWDAANGGWRPPRLSELEPDLAALLERALARRPEDRIGCDALLEQLERYRFAQGLSAGARQLRGFMNELFPDEQRAVRSMLQSYASAGSDWDKEEIDQTTSIARSERTPPVPSLSPEDATATESIAVSSSVSLEESASETARNAPFKSPAPLAKASRASSGRAFLAGAIGVSLLAALVLWLSPERSTNSGALDVDRVAAASASERRAPHASGSSGNAQADRAPPAPPPAESESADAARKDVEGASTARATEEEEVVRDVVHPPSEPNPARAKEPLPSSAMAPAGPGPSTPTPPPATAPASTAEANGKANAAANDAPKAAIDIDSLTFEQKIVFLESKCLALPCAKALVGELRGLALSEVSTQRLATAVDDVKRCLHQCLDD